MRNYRTIGNNNANVIRGSNRFEKDDIFKSSIKKDVGESEYNGSIDIGEINGTSPILTNNPNAKTTTWFNVNPLWQYWKFGGLHAGFQLRFSNGSITNPGNTTSPTGAAGYDIPANVTQMRITFTKTGQDIVPIVKGVRSNG